MPRRRFNRAAQHPVRRPDFTFAGGTLPISPRWTRGKKGSSENRTKLSRRLEMISFIVTICIDSSRLSPPRQPPARPLYQHHRNHNGANTHRSLHTKRQPHQRQWRQRHLTPPFVTDAKCHEQCTRSRSCKCICGCCTNSQPRPWKPRCSSLSYRPCLL